MPRVVLALVAVCALSVGCSRAYYSTMKAFGKEKRDILASRVKDAREDQQEAQEEFASALERFQALLGPEAKDTELQKMYDALSDELEDCEADAKDVRERVDAVEDVGEDLFDEWADELDQYESKELRRKSERQLRDTRRRFDDLLKAMRRAEASMEPVLEAFRDQVLFLKHNLNAQAVAQLRGVAASLEQDVERLVKEMQAAIAEADAFVKQMEAPGEPD
jgi:ElaB/YqjD/DUF883 family membrane-anchored ribosome-binding protein